MAPVRSRRPLKSWRYVGVFGPDLMLCAGHASVAGLPQRLWAVWDRGARAFHEETRMRAGAWRSRAAVLVRGRDLSIDLVLESAGEPVEVVSHGRSYIWTRKRPAHARGSVRAGGRMLRVAAAPALRRRLRRPSPRPPAWDWKPARAAPQTAAGSPGTPWPAIHDDPATSERTVWVDGVATPADPVTFSDALDAVGGLRFDAEAQRVRHDRLLVVESEYRQPFGRFNGALPGGIHLAEGFGVMERHRARW